MFLDTNVWISSFITTGVCAEIVDRCLLEHRILISAWMLDELQKTLKRKFKLLPSEITKLLSSVEEKCELVKEASLRSVCKDADDDHILAAAKQGKADFLLTGDKDLLVLKNFEGIPILSPNSFWKLEEDGSSR